MIFLPCIIPVEVQNVPFESLTDDRQPNSKKHLVKLLPTNINNTPRKEFCSLEPFILISNLLFDSECLNRQKSLQLCVKDSLIFKYD